MAGKSVTQKAVTEEKPPLKMVIFDIGDESFGIDIFRISEITRIMEITKVPRSLGFIEGVINLRGKVIPVVDLRKRLGLPVKERDRASRIIIVAMRGYRLGLLVDAVTRVVNIPQETIEQVPAMTLEIDSAYIKGVGHMGDQLLILLDLDRLLDAHEHRLLASRLRKPKPKGEAPQP